MSAEERARLTNIALAELGYSGVQPARPTPPHLPLAVTFGNAPAEIASKAAAFASWKMFGPDFAMPCAHHAWQRSISLCALVPACDATRSLPCRNVPLEEA